MWAISLKIDEPQSFGGRGSPDTDLGDFTIGVPPDPPPDFRTPAARGTS